MQEEATQKTIALVFRATSFTAKHFEAVLREAKRDLEHQQNKIQTRRAQSRASRPRRPRQRHGQMTVSQLVGQGQGASTMTIPDDIRAFERIARRYNVDFAIQRDRSVRPPKYTVFFKAKDTDVLKECFKDYLAHQDRRRDRTPFKERLKNMKEKVKDMAQAVEKKLHRGDRSL
ncbi:MAG: PcfB family protein [Lachnospiraceae bacterium]|nr:PcfB family protein [Lachnospiraceae bacterium]